MYKGFDYNFHRKYIINTHWTKSEKSSVYFNFTIYIINIYHNTNDYIIIREKKTSNRDYFIKEF